MLPTDYTSFKVVARYPSPADDTIVIAKVSAYGKLALADVEGTVFVRFPSLFSPQQLTKTLGGQLRVKPPAFSHIGR